MSNVAVIGAGPMGLGVAYQLVNDGHRVVIYEADDRIGGMSGSFDFNGIRIERFYHFICAGDQPLFDILGELGISNTLRWTQTKMGYFLDGQLHDWGDPIALLKCPALGPIEKLRYGAHAFLSTKRKNWRPLDNQSAPAWLRKWVGRSAYDKLWAPLLDLKFYEYADRVSAAWIWCRIKRMGTSRYDLFREKLGYLEGGSDTILEALRHGIKEGGGEINLCTPVQEVEIEGGSVRGIRTRAGTTEFDAVISTAPIPYVPLMIPHLPDETRLRLESVINIGVVCVIAKLRRPVTDKFWVNINAPDIDIPGLVEYTNLRPMEHHIVYVPFYMPTSSPKFRDPDEAFVEKVRRYVQRLNPAIKPDDILDVRVNRLKHAQPVCEPGFLEKLPSIDVPIEGLYIADTSYYFPEDRGISESVRLGRKMARMVTG